MRILTIFALVLAGCGDPDGKSGDGGNGGDNAGTDNGGGDSGGDSGGGDSGGGDSGGDSGSADVDSDGDGLLDSEEAKYGTDPDEADSDGDGYEDGEEVDLGTNPAYEYSHPYAQGDYNVGWCDAPPAPTGPTGDAASHNGWPLYVNGDVADNFTLTDQYGQDVDLYSFCGQHVMVVFAASW